MKIFGILVAVVMTLSTTIALAFNRHVKVSNYSDKTVVQLYGSNSSENSWQEDILRSGILGPGESVIINFYDGSDHCLYDIKVVYSDGGVGYKTGFNVCQESNLFIR
jgi:hypothetical protein